MGNLLQSSTILGILSFSETQCCASKRESPPPLTKMSELRVQLSDSSSFRTGCEESKHSDRNSQLGSAEGSTTCDTRASS